MEVCLWCRLPTHCHSLSLLAGLQVCICVWSLQTGHGLTFMVVAQVGCLVSYNGSGCSGRVVITDTGSLPSNCALI